MMYCLYKSIKGINCKYNINKSGFQSRERGILILYWNGFVSLKKVVDTQILYENNKRIKNDPY